MKDGFRTTEAAIGCANELSRDAAVEQQIFGEEDCDD
jgi:hypothetical protein